MCLHPFVSLNNEQNCREIREDKMPVGRKTAGVSDMSSACSRMLVHVKIFQFQDMLNESQRYCDATNGLNEAIVREHFPIQTADDIVADMAGAQYSSEL